MDSTFKLPRSTPEEQGVRSEAIQKLLEAIQANRIEVHSLMLLRHGHVIAEGWWSPYRPDEGHMLFSLSKSFTSTAIGLAREEGLLSLDDRVIDYFPEELPAEVSANLAEMRIRDLLTMGTGHDKEPPFNRDGETNWARGFLSAAVEHRPGTRFVYNSGATYMLSAILHQVTGQPLLEYLEPRLFGPLGIKGAQWETCPRGIAAGGWGLMIQTEDIAKFGQLYLQRGIWNGKRLLPAGWTEEATAGQIRNGSEPDNDWTQGYGYQFWRCRHGAYRADGAFGQFCIVMPEQDAVAVFTSGTNVTHLLLSVLWSELLPGLAPEALPADPAAHGSLSGQLRELAYEPPAATEQVHPAGRRWEGGRYRLSPMPFGLETMAFRVSGREAELAVGTSSGEQTLLLYEAEWRENQIYLFPPDRLQRVAASFRWIASDTLEITLRLVEGPFVQTITCSFSKDGETLEMTVDANVGFGPQKTYTLQGRKEKIEI
ncbi:serine hydrolase domain-containing protein [Gorillibacterium sp. sgz5001074]|uniref:serine hydrolase domain-containing protein n=1 Tax=Gorillibacterium sp. sgz5001074 TaxID=3446695 RepID=UPI003F6810A5